MRARVPSMSRSWCNGTGRYARASPKKTRARVIRNASAVACRDSVSPANKSNTQRSASTKCVTVASTNRQSSNLYWRWLKVDLVLDGTAGLVQEALGEEEVDWPALALHEIHFAVRTVDDHLDHLAVGEVLRARPPRQQPPHRLAADGRGVVAYRLAGRPAGLGDDTRDLRRARGHCNCRHQRDPACVHRTANLTTCCADRRRRRSGDRRWR